MAISSFFLKTRIAPKRCCARWRNILPCRYLQIFRRSNQADKWRRCGMENNQNRRSHPDADASERNSACQQKMRARAVQRWLCPNSMTPCARVLGGSAPASKSASRAWQQGSKVLPLEPVQRLAARGGRDRHKAADGPGLRAAWADGGFSLFYP